MKGATYIRTLLVDDNDTFREDFRAFAEDLPGVEIVGEAGNGAQAIKQAVVLQPDLVLMDFALPGMNGMETMQRIQQTHSARRVIIITAHENTELRTLCRENGADGFISKFTLCNQLPPLIASLFMPQKEAIPPAAGRRDCILLIEDYAEVRHLALRMLETGGYDVLAAGSAEEGLAIFKCECDRIDLVLSDIILPGQDGLSAVTQMRQHKPELGVLLCSGYADEQTQRRAITEHQFPFLPKPYSNANLLEAVHAALAGRPAPPVAVPFSKTHSRVTRFAPAPHVRQAAPRRHPTRASEEPLPHTHR